MTVTAEQRRQLMLRISREIIVGGDVGLVDELFAADYLDHDPFPGLPADREGFKGAVAALHRALPDLTVDVQLTLVDGDKVAYSLTSSGTHDGDFMGIPPTGRSVVTSAIEILRIDDAGLAKERWQRFGALQMLQQIGVVPGWEEPPPVPPMPEVRGAAPSSPEQNREVMLRQLAIWNDGDDGVADEIFHPGAITPDAPQLPVGPDGVKQVARVFRHAFPDFRMTVEDVLAEGEYVCCRFRQTGTHEGELFGVPPTGRSVDFGELAICRIVGGRIVASWFQTDMLSLMGQLGVADAQPAPA